MGRAKSRAVGRFAATAGVVAVVAIVVGIGIYSHHTADSSVNGGGTAPAKQTVIASTASPIANGTPRGSVSGGNGTQSRSASPSPTTSETAPGSSSATPASARSQPTTSSALPRVAVSPTVSASDPGATVTVCTSAHFDQKLNVCAKADVEMSAGNGGLTVDGDVSFPDYMTGMISLLHKNGTTWQRVGEFSTKTYPDVVVIDSNRFISVQLANVFVYGGHRAVPACSSNWGIEVDDTQGLPLGDAMFTYICG